MDDLLKQAAHGDRNAFSELVLIFQQPLYKIARSKLDNDCDICDALQNTLLLAYKNIRKVKNLSFFQTWLIRILLNECNAIYRKKKQSGVFLADVETVRYLADRAKTSGDDYSAVESNLDFQALISMLNDDEKEVVTLFYSCDLTTREISRLIGVNENTIKTRLCRARNKIAKKIRGVETGE